MIKTIALFALRLVGFPVINRPFVWAMGNPTFFLQQKSKKLGQFFQIEKLLDKFYA